jgi:hypothetical protein
MRRPCFVLILFVLLGFCVPLAVPAEDVTETAYDESEGLPYEATPLFSSEVPQASAWIAKAELRCDSLLRFNSLTKCRKPGRENDTRLHGVPDSLTILNHSLRC